MSRVVFDIETIGLPWDGFESKQQDYLVEKFSQRIKVLIKLKVNLLYIP